MVISLRAITDDELQCLKKWAKRNHCAVEMRRAQIILAASQQRKVTEIAATFHYSKEHVRKLIKSFNDGGLNSLKKAKSTGRPKQFSQEQCEAIITLAKTSPSSLGYDWTTWTLHTLKIAIIDSQIAETISIETIRQLLKSSSDKTDLQSLKE